MLSRSRTSLLLVHKYTCVKWHVSTKSLNMMSMRNIRSKIKSVDAIFKRELQQQSAEPAKNEITEVQIKVPWGIIAGKLWGDRNKQPILALHGWQDNASSFDLLAPLLKNRSILAIDKPGHGLSSWLPKGIPYHDSMTINTIRRIKRYFGWEKVKLLAHSAGAIACFNYTSFYPDETEFVIAIDSLQPKPLNLSKLSQRNKVIARHIDKFLENEEKNTAAPCHTEEVAIQRWIKGTDGSLNEIAARTLMTRGATRKEDGTFFYNRDPNIRLNASNIGYTAEYLKQSAHLIKCPYLLVQGTESKLKEYISKDVVDIMQNGCKEFSFHTIPGTHHLHMVNAEGVAEIVNPFLERHGKLWGSTEKQPLLALHGWQDNAGSFDLLSPLIRNSSVLAIDIPGHGLSSWLPKGIPYNDITTILAIRQLKNYFGWEKVKFLGHSGGALISFIYASFFPEETEFVIALDGLQYKPIDIIEHKKLYAKNIDKFFELESKISPLPSYEETELIEKWMKSTNNSLNEMAVRIMMIRGTKTKEDGTIVLTRDPRVKLNIPLRAIYTLEYLKKLAKLIKCPYLVLRSLDTVPDVEFSEDIIKIMKNNCKEFSFISLPGTHHLHLTISKDVAEILVQFLERYD